MIIEKLVYKSPNLYKFHTKYKNSAKEKKNLQTFQITEFEREKSWSSEPIALLIFLLLCV
jgi:hypothetical protein